MNVFETKPDDSEYAPYYGTYINLVPAGDVRDHLRMQGHETIALLAGLSDSRADKPYAPGKWTLKQVISHMTDAERVFSYRMLSFGRGDPAPLPSFDQEQWVPTADANARSVASLVLEFAAVRSATVQLASSLTEAAFVRRGVASGNAVSVRAIAFICAGHELHHRTIIRERYLRV
jgi:uncharacterized damage-inducible protein DinB